MNLDDLSDQKYFMKSIVKYNEPVIKQIIQSFGVTKSNDKVGNLFGHSSLFNNRYKIHSHIAEHQHANDSSNDVVQRIH